MSDEPVTEPVTRALDVPGAGDTAPLDLSRVRREYDRGGLSRLELEEDPFAQFGAWMQQALESENVEPTAATLATLGENGMPAARVVLLKGFDERGFRFFTNYSSRKGRELAAHPKASLCFFWPEIQRQARIEGDVVKISRDESAEYFHTRPHASQVSAAASPQSRPVKNRDELENRRRELEETWAGKEVPLPETWGGYRIQPVAFEFWQGRISRLHDRFRYERSADGAWTIERLAP